MCTQLDVLPGDGNTSFNHLPGRPLPRGKRLLSLEHSQGSQPQRHFLYSVPYITSIHVLSLIRHYSSSVQHNPPDNGHWHFISWMQPTQHAMGHLSSFFLFLSEPRHTATLLKNICMSKAINFEQSCAIRWWIAVVTLLLCRYIIQPFYTQHLLMSFSDA